MEAPILPAIRQFPLGNGRFGQSVYNRQTDCADTPAAQPEPPAAMLNKFALRASLLLTTLVATLFPLHAEAAKWTKIGSKNNAKIEIDGSSLDRGNEDKLQVWHRENYDKPQIPDSGAFSFVSLTVLTEFNCSKRLATPLRRTYIASDGSELKTESYDSRDTTPVVPDSITEVVFNYACKQKKAATAPVIAEKPVAPPPPVDDPKAGKKKSRSSKEEAPPAPPPPPAVHWDYEGKAGAGKWGKLSEDYAVCGIGQRQSPIDIRESIGADLPPIRFSYKAVPLSIVDNGHTIQVNMAGGGNISVEGEDYELLQFHFHKPSEEKINGKTYDMVAHLVHQSKSGKLAVVAVMLQAGKEQRLIRTLWNNLPLEQNRPINKSEISIDPAQLLPATRGYFTYIGSLTTPPCSEGVLWLVLKTPTTVSKEQVDSFGKIYKNNARPIQARGGRVIKDSR